MGLTAYAACWFLPAVIPIAVFVAWNDMRVMKIPNLAAGALLLSFAVLGIFALPFVTYLWHWTHFAVVLAVGILFWMSGVIGGGDVKFMAAAAPMVAVADLRMFLLIYASCLLAALVTHRLAKHSPLRKIAPDWLSWDNDRFPKGLALSGTILFYLLVVAITR
ncbi:prepilin peptidase [Yoonia sp. I 8.24]|uniref:prepilin peptidase n=1 Tax=Yoonia sp. I 8.24 TaxID=1537229 RepID=UPI001F8B6C4B|nr:prepilin peptidase [Yoonia sp. I 8.24]MCG3267986.1 prepilin peptidase [Yoonia sp. I 8.24]